MANLLKIKELIKERGLTIRSFAADIGMTEQGLQKLIRDNSTKIETLELISKKLSVSIMIFFEENSEAKKEPLDSYLKKYIEQLEFNLNEKKDTVKEKEETIKRLWKEIDDLRAEKNRMVKTIERLECIKNDVHMEGIDPVVNEKSLTG